MLKGILTDDREVQYSNAHPPILVTLSGIFTSLSSWQPIKEKVSRDVTGSPSIVAGISAFVADLSQL